MLFHIFDKKNMYNNKKKQIYNHTQKHFILKQNNIIS